MLRDRDEHITFLRLLIVREHPGHISRALTRQQQQQYKLYRQGLHAHTYRKPGDIHTAVGSWHEETSALPLTSIMYKTMYAQPGEQSHGLTIYQVCHTVPNHIELFYIRI